MQKIPVEIHSGEHVMKRFTASIREVLPKEKTFAKECTHVMLIPIVIMLFSSGLQVIAGTQEFRIVGTRTLNKTDFVRKVYLKAVV